MNQSTATPLLSKLSSAWAFMLGGMLAGGIHALASSWVGPLALSHWPEWLNHESAITSWLGPFALSPLLSLLALVLLATLIARANFWKAVLAGWAFGLTWLGGSLWWLYVSMHYYGGLPSPLAALAVFLLAAGLALFYAIAAGLIRIASPKGTVCMISFAAAWLLAEMARGWLLTGLPWAASGYAHTSGMLAAYAPWLGVYGVSAVGALVAAAIALLVQYGMERKVKHKKLQKIHAILGVSMLVLVLGATLPLKHDFTQSTGKMKVALLQGNIPQDLKFDGRVAAESFNWYLTEMQRAKANGAELVLTPEVAVVYFPQELPWKEQQTINEIFATGDMAGLIGFPTVSQQRRVMNSMLGFSPEQATYQYDKYHLVPFGEFIPWGFRWFVNMMNIPLGDMDRGSIDAGAFAWRGQLIAPNICYEDLFGEELARRFNLQGGQPTIMANASNIAWFGDTVAVPQHMQIARMRSLEFQRPMIRATNTGATAVINHKGLVQSALPYYEEAVLLDDVEGRTGLTPYAWWAGQWGLLPLGSLGLLTLFGSIFVRRKFNLPF